MNEILDLLKKEITYLKKLKLAIGDIHGHIHSLAVKAAKMYLEAKHRKVESWELSEKYAGGIDIVGRDAHHSRIVVAEVKTTARSEKESLGSPQKSRIKKDVEKLCKTGASYKYLFIIDNKNRKAFEDILKNNQKTAINLVNILEWLKNLE
jgi:hypothetical protein